MIRRLAFPIAMFAVVFGLLLTWTIGTPLFGSPDEPAHLYKSYGTAHFQAIGEAMDESISNIRRFDVPEQMGQSPGIMCWVFQADASVACETPGHIGAGESAAAVYPPFWYAVVGGGARLVGQETHQRWYRAMGALLCAVLIAVAFAVADRSRARRFSPLLLLALAPMTLFLAGTVNPNGFEIAGFVLLWVLCLHADHERAPTALGGTLVGAAVAVLLLSRFASALWVAAGEVVVAVAFGVDGVRRFVRRSFLVPALSISGAAVVALLAWSRYAGAQAEDPRIATDASAREVARLSWERMPEYLRQMIGILGWLDTRLPWFVYALFAVFTAVAIAGVVASRQPRLMVAALLAAAGLVAIPIVINVMSARSAGILWQGRYGLPLFAMFAWLGMLGWRAALDRRDAEAADADGADPSERLVVLAVAAVAAACFVVAEVAAFWQMLRRFSVGANGKVWLDDPLPWQPAVAPIPLIAINAVLAVALAAVVSVRALSPEARTAGGLGPATPSPVGAGPADPPTG